MNKKHPFGYSVNTSTLSCGEIALEAKIAAAEQAGYEGIEPWVKEIDAFTSAGGDLAALRRRFDDAGLKVANLIGFFEWAVPDAGRRRKGVEEARRCFDLAARLGCPYVAAPPTGIADTAGIDLCAVAERYAELIDLGRGAGVTPLLEFWGFAKSLNRLGAALFVAAECGRSEARILADVFHMYKCSGQFHGLDLIGANAIGLFHMNDYPATPARGQAADKDRVYPGDGVAPLADILNALRQAGYRGMLSLELFNPSYWAQDAGSVARIGLAKMKAAVAAALD